MIKKEKDLAIGAEYRRFITSGLLALNFEKLSNPKMIKGFVKGDPENVFLGKWLIRAYNKKLYMKEIADNILAMITLYKSKGGKADLIGIFRQHYMENKTVELCHSEFQSTALERLRIACTLLEKNSWKVNYELNYDPGLLGPYQPENEKEIFGLMPDWQNSIASDGSINKELRLYATEVLQEVVDTLYEMGFYTFVVNKSQTDDRFDKPRWFYCLDIYPHDRPKEGVEIPSIYRGLCS
jgi:hypothetical protein